MLPAVAAKYMTFDPFDTQMIRWAEKCPDFLFKYVNDQLKGDEKGKMKSSLQNPIGNCVNRDMSAFVWIRRFYEQKMSTANFASSAAGQPHQFKGF